MLANYSDLRVNLEPSKHKLSLPYTLPLFIFSSALASLPTIVETCLFRHCTLYFLGRLASFLHVFLLSLLILNNDPRHFAIIQSCQSYFHNHFLAGVAHLAILPTSQHHQPPTWPFEH